MELKVWVEGIQRVVCGATFDTTCQDVVVALARALGHTGRFTLVEKWRDSDRPLMPAECPLRTLCKWGEYAAEVRFILHRADSGHEKQSIQDKLIKKVNERSLFLHNYSLCGITGDSVKRSSTFSGAHSFVPSASELPSSSEHSKSGKPHLGPVPNGDIKQHSEPHLQSTHSLSKQPQRPESSQKNRILSAPHESSQQGRIPSSPHQRPVPPPRRRSSPAPQQSRDIISKSALPVVPPPSPVLLSRSDHPCHHSQQFDPLPKPQPVFHAHSHPQLHNQIHPQFPGPVQRPARTHAHAKSPSPQPPPLPSSPPPSQVISLHQCFDSKEHQRTLADVEASIAPSSHSHQERLELEEYDLERNFPDNHRDSTRPERSCVSLEYRLEDSVGSGSGRHLEGEHAKMIRLVNMQQERLKTQESQLSLVNTEITALEEKEKEYEEKLQVVMEELLQHENHQHELETQLSDLEKVEWENVLDGEKKCEVDLRRKISACKAKILEYEHKLEEARKKEKQLQSELKVEEETIFLERERLKAEETRVKEEERRIQDEISKLQKELNELQRKAADGESTLLNVESEFKSLENNLGGKAKELIGLETDLKDESLKDSAANPKQRENAQAHSKENTGETIIKILEGRLSPRLKANDPSKASDNPSVPPFIAALAPKNQSGVWV